jgi:hypothetical protein
MELREYYDATDVAQQALVECPSRPVLGEVVVWDVGTSGRGTTRPEHWPAMLFSLQMKPFGSSVMWLALVLTRQGRIKRVNARFIRRPRARQ